jgi:hypothetical protein
MVMVFKVFEQGLVLPRGFSVLVMDLVSIFIETSKRIDFGGFFFNNKASELFKLFIFKKSD